MDVGLVVLGDVEMDDGGDIVDVDSAGRDIGGDHRLNATAGEILKGTGALLLAAPTVNSNRRDAGARQLLSEPVSAVPRPAKDDGGPHLSKSGGEKRGPFGARHGPEDVIGRDHIRRVGRNLVTNRIALILADESSDITVEGG